MKKLLIANFEVGEQTEITELAKKEENLKAK